MIQAQSGIFYYVSVLSVSHNDAIYMDMSESFSRVAETFTETRANMEARSFEPANPETIYGYDGLQEPLATVDFLAKPIGTIVQMTMWKIDTRGRTIH